MTDHELILALQAQITHLERRVNDQWREIANLRAALERTLILLRDQQWKQMDHELANYREPTADR